MDTQIDYIESQFESNRLVDKIRNYWLERGHNIQVSAFNSSSYGTRIVIRSNLLNGLPRA